MALNYKKIEFWFLVISIILLGFAMVSDASAASYVTTNSTSTTARIRPVGVSSDRSICQVFQPGSLSATSLSAWFSVGSGGYNPYFQMSGPFASEALAVASAPTSTPGNLWNAGSMGTALTSPTYLTVATTTPVTFNSGSYYIACFKTSGGSSGVVEYIYGANTGGGASAYGGSLLDSLSRVYLKLEGTVPGAYTGTLSYSTLTGGSSYQDFSYVPMTYQFSSSSLAVNGGTILVQFATSSDFASVFATALDTTVYYSDSSQMDTIPINNSLWLGTSTQIYSRAFLYDYNYNVLASTTVNFYVTEPYSLSNYYGAGEESIRSVLIGKFPFVYFYQMGMILEGLPEYSTSTPLSVGFSFPSSSVWASSGTTTLFSQAQIESMVGTGTLQTIHDFIEFLLYAVFAFDIYLLVRKIFNR